MYSYLTERHHIFTDEGQRIFLKVRDKACRLLSDAGCFRMDKVIPSGDSWIAMAYVDRMVELGEISEVANGKTAGQHRMFTFP